MKAWVSIALVEAEVGLLASYFAKGDTLFVC